MNVVYANPKDFNGNRIIELGNDNKGFTNRSVLLADDDYVNYLYYQEILEDMGIRTYRAISLGQLLFKMKMIRNIDLILISSSFSAQFEYKLNRYLRDRYPHIPQISILNEETDMEIRSKLADGSDTLLTSQIDGYQLLDAVHDLFNTPTNVRIAQSY